MSRAQERVDTAVSQRSGKLAEMGEALKGETALAFIRGIAPGLDARAVLMTAYAHVSGSPVLMDCQPKSVVRAVAEAAKLGLVIDGVLGHAYLVPFKDRRAGVTLATMMIGYRGIAHLGYESGKVSRIHADTICEHDDYAYVEGVAPMFRHERPLSDRGKKNGVYALAHPIAGGPPWIVVLGRDEVEKRRESSASWKGKREKSPWTTHEDAMWKKTAIRELGKVLPVAVMQSAALRDEARDEGRMVPPSTIDLGPDDATVSDATPNPATTEKTRQQPPSPMGDVGDAVRSALTIEAENLKAGACKKCGTLKLREDGSCHDCQPDQPAEGGS